MEGTGETQAKPAKMAGEFSLVTQAMSSVFLGVFLEQ